MSRRSAAPKRARATRADGEPAWSRAGAIVASLAGVRARMCAPVRAWVVTALIASCRPELVSDPVVTRGRHVTVYADPEIPVCAAAVASADRFVEDVAAMLGVAPPAIDYHLYDGPTGCGYGRSGDISCVMSGTVYANVWIHHHELVHAVDRSYPPAFFVEGLAEALSLPSDVIHANAPDRATAVLDLTSSVFRGSEPGESYRVAGDFVRYVVERFGAERYHAFARSLLSLSDTLTIEREFARSFGIALPVVIADWRATPPSASRLRVPADLVECADPLAPIGADAWGMDDIEPHGCRSGVTDAGTLYVQPTHRVGFEVHEAGMFVVRATGESPLGGAIRSCVTGDVHAYPVTAAAEQLVVLPLAAGRHAIDVATGTRAWNITRIGALGRACETAPALAAPATAGWQLEVRGRPATWLRVDAAAPAQLEIAGAAGARACTGGCTALACRPLGGDATVLDVAPGRPLHVALGPDGARSELQSVMVTAR